jgi:hypothetical protein
MKLFPLPLREGLRESEDLYNPQSEFISRLIE